MEQRNKMVFAETVTELLALLEPLADDGYVKWPVNRSLIFVLEDDRARNLHTARQEFDEVEPRPVTAAPIPKYWEEDEDPALAEEMYLAAIAAGVEVAPAFYERFLRNQGR